MQGVALDANGRWIKCALNAKFTVFHTNLGKYPTFGTLKNFQTLEIFQKIFLSKFEFFKEFFSKNFFIALLKRYVKRQPILLKFHCKNPEMYKFHCFQDHYTLLK